MKKPDEIKKGLECCHINSEDSCDCEECPYAVNGFRTKRCDIDMAEDVLTLTQYLQDGIDQWELIAASPGAVEDMARENANLYGKIEQLETKCHQLERERNAAVADLKEEMGCKRCSKYTWTEEYVSTDCLDCINKCNWEWCGVKED